MSSKSNIDKLFKDGLGNPSPHSFNEDAWNNMNSMLNERDKFSWMSLGKLASAALFLSTLFIGSTIPDAQLIASSETTTQSNAVSSIRPFAKNSTTLESNSSSLFGSKDNASFFTSADSDISGNKIPENGESNKTLIAMYGRNNSIAPIASKASNNVVSSLAKQETSYDGLVSKKQAENPSLNSDISTISKITPSSLEAFNVEFPEYGFDPVDASTMPKNYIRSLSVFGGITLENGLGSASQLSTNNLLYTAGFYYNIEATPNISVSTGLGYRTKSGKGIELSRTQTEYGFGKSQTTETLALNRLHYIDLPIEVRYDIKGQHSVFGGASISYLAGVKSAIAKTHDESFQSSISSVENTWNYKDGLNKWDAGVRVGYDYNLGQNLSIGGMVQYGLMDITSNETFDVQDNSNNLEVRVTLKYTPFRF